MRLRRTLSEIHMREALAFSALVLCLVGVPLGIWIRRESKLASFAIALIVFVVHYALIAGAEGMAVKGRLAPAAALWTPDLLTAALQNKMTPDAAIEAVVATLPESLAELVVINQVRLLRRTSLLEALETNPGLNNDQRRRLRELR